MILFIVIPALGVLFCMRRCYVRISYSSAAIRLSNIFWLRDLCIAEGADVTLSHAFEENSLPVQVREESKITKVFGFLTAPSRSTLSLLKIELVEGNQTRTKFVPFANPEALKRLRIEMENRRINFKINPDIRKMFD